MTLSLEGWPTKAKEATSVHKVRLTPLDTHPVFQDIWDKREPPAYLHFVKINERLLKTCFNNLEILTTNIHIL